MLASFLVIGSILLGGIGIICFNVKIGCFKIIQRLQTGKQNRGFITELYGKSENSFDYEYLLPIFIENTNNVEINKYIEKHNISLGASFATIFIAIIFMIIASILGIE